MDINRQIAEKVMGWHLEDVNIGGPRWFKKGISISVQANHDWHPSTDIKQAFEVVEKMDERKWWLDKLSNLGISTTKPWTAVFWKAEKWEIKSAEASTPSMAICLAALKAVK